MWVAQYYNTQKPRNFPNSGLGTIDYGMGSAMGRQRRRGNYRRRGGFGMNLNELATAVSQNLPLIVVILNNGVLGMIRQWQNIFFEITLWQAT